MKKEVVILIIGVIALAVLYYFLTKKSTTVTPTTSTGLVPTATSAISKLGTAVTTTSADIKAVYDALTGLLAKKTTQPTVAGDSSGSDAQYYV